MTDDLTRRGFSRKALGALLTYSLLETVGQQDLFSAEIKPVTRKWLTQVNALSHSIKKQQLRQVEWQLQVEELFGQIELPELLKLLDFDRLTKGLKYVDNGARSIRFQFPKIEGLPTNYVFGKQIFAMKKGRSVVPHGHNNMATAFLVLKGDLRGRHYDRVEDGKEDILIRPTIDKIFKPGDHSSISDYKDNIHWFKAETEPAFIFNIHVMDVTPSSTRPTGRVYVDPQGEKIAGNLIRAKRLGYQEAHKLYG